MSRLLLLRHGESEFNAEGRLQGQADPELSEVGREQARAVAATVARLEVAGVVSSDLRRASETAAIAGHAGATIDRRWRERNMGAWENQLDSSIEDADMEAFRTGDLVPAGAETWADFQARVAGAVSDLGARGGDWLVFTHGGCVRAAVAELTGADWRTVAGPGNASLSVLQLGAQPRLLAFNWTAGSPDDHRPTETGSR